MSARSLMPVIDRSEPGPAPSSNYERVAVSLDYIERTLDGLEHRPSMYAWGAEALQNEAMLLVALRQRLWGYHDFDVHACVCQFTDAVNGERRPIPLWCILREEGRLRTRHDNFRDLPGLLGDFARWVAREWPPIEAR
jgi:hypothetical protein